MLPNVLNTLNYYFPRIVLLLVVSAWITPSALQAQEAYPLSFFKDKAQADAAYEQELNWRHPEDEIDYWKDQKRFEERLKAEDFQGYRTYLGQKKLAYLSHREQCTNACRHGNYYFIQASFYTRYEDDHKLLTSRLGRTGGSASQAPD